MITKRIDNKEYKLVIEYDEYPTNPREWDNLWTIVTAHRNYCFDEELPSDCDSISQAFENHLEYKWLSIDEVYYLPVYLYDHSGQSVSTKPFSCSWDSWQLWYIYVSKEKIKTDTLLTTNIKEKALEYLNAEIEDLNRYLTWDILEAIVEVRDFTIQDWKEFYTEWENYESCGWLYNKEDFLDYCNIFTEQEVKDYNID